VYCLCPQVVIGVCMLINALFILYTISVSCVCAFIPVVVLCPCASPGCHGNGLLLVLDTPQSWSMKSLLRLLDLGVSVGLIVGGLFLVTVSSPLSHVPHIS